jgi:eukaryotic-like serine/threonine-protein kinase
MPAVPLVRTDLDEPTVGDRYELRRVLGSGGMGSVWEAYDQRLGRMVALKVLRDDLPPGAAERLEREARAAARILDRRVVTVLDLDRTADGNPYLVLECHDGATLADELREGPLPADRFDRLVEDLLGALAAAHECGVLHRDVKPANVLADVDGFRVTDFGLASLDDDQTTETDLMGTLVYVAPERLDGARGTTRSDVFSAAVVLHEAATGVQPFRTGNAAESVARLRNGDAPELPEELPAALRDTLRRALSPDPADRPTDAREMLAAINDHGGPAVPADPTVRLDATTVLPTAGAASPADAGPAAEPSAVVAKPADRTTEQVPVAPAAPVRPDEERDTAPRSVFVPAEPSSDHDEPPRTESAPVRRDLRRDVAERVQPAVDLIRRRPELLIGAIAAALLVLLLLAVALDGGSDDQAPAADAPTEVEAPATLDGVLERIEELGR